jgi:hypothetical protein
MSPLRLLFFIVCTSLFIIGGIAGTGINIQNQACLDAGETVETCGMQEVETLYTLSGLAEDMTLEKYGYSDPTTFVELIVIIALVGIILTLKIVVYVTLYGIHFSIAQGYTSMLAWTILAYTTIGLMIAIVFRKLIILAGYTIYKKIKKLV